MCVREREKTPRVLAVSHRLSKVARCQRERKREKEKESEREK